jgi:hypothetical protein
MIACALGGLVLLATKEMLWGQFGDAGEGTDLNQLFTIMGCTALALLICMGWRLFQERESRTFSANSPARLFRELCAAHKLQRSSRRLLKRLAEARGLTSPSLLFVEPEHFDEATLPANLSASAKDLRQLSERLFG